MTEDHLVDITFQNDENNTNECENRIDASEISENDLFIQNIAQLYLKLEREFLILHQMLNI